MQVPGASLCSRLRTEKQPACLTVTLMVEAFAISDPGLVRKTNEDSYICNDHLQLYVVADGMGGHSAGEVASRVAVETIEGFFNGSRDDSDFSLDDDPQLSPGGNRLRKAVHLANRSVFRTSESRDDYAGMGTTVTAVLIVGDSLSYAHVGDSRLYRLQGAAAVQVTQDDSWVATLLANEPNLKQSDLAHHPMRHVLTNVVGAREQVDVQHGEIALAAGGLFLLCSDGLYGMTDEATLSATLAAGGPLDEMARGLVQAALAGGGHDNITAVLLRIAEPR
jgi:serine/threonine protein phosphatase PrpC